MMLPSISAYLKKSCTEKSFFLSGCASANVDDLLTSCGTNSMSSVSETADSVDRRRSTFDKGMLSSRAGNICAGCCVPLALSTASLSPIPPPSSWSLTGAGAGTGDAPPMILARGGGAPTFAKPRLERNPSKSALFPSIIFLRTTNCSSCRVAKPNSSPFCLQASSSKCRLWAKASNAMQSRSSSCCCGVAPLL